MQKQKRDAVGNKPGDADTDRCGAVYIPSINTAAQFLTCIFFRENRLYLLVVFYGALEV